MNLFNILCRTLIAVSLTVLTVAFVAAWAVVVAEPLNDVMEAVVTAAFLLIIVSMWQDFMEIWREL